MSPWLTAVEIAASVRSGKVRAADVVAAAKQRIASDDHRLNAFMALSDRSASDAAAIDAGDGRNGVLAGVPVAIKDLIDTAGITTTYGSRAFAGHIPARDDLVVTRLKAAGAVVVGKTTTPEFGFGAICANAMKTATCNPWNLSLTSGGSSGGSAAAVAAGLVPLAHGTDFGGSVRTPASFCGVLSLRPTPGLVPNPGRALAFDTLASHGAMARSVDDLAAFLSAVAGPDARDPTSYRVPAGDGEVEPTDGPLRIAATPDFGVARISKDVRAAMQKAVASVADAFGPVAWRHPDCTGAVAAFHGLRQPIIRHAFAPLLARHADLLSPTLRWAIAQGDGIAAADYLAAEARRSTLYRHFGAMFEEVDVLLAPAAAVLPWPNAVPEVTDIDGESLPTIIDYLAVTFIVSLAGCPVVTLPAWTAGALPFSIQLIGAPGSDRRLLAIARRFESACDFAFRRPPAFAST